MSRKKAQKVVKEQESGSFLAAEKQPIASPAPEVIGKQKIKQEVKEIKRVDQLIKMQKGEIIASIQYYIEDALSQIAKEHTENQTALILEGILNIYDMQKRINWLFEYRNADKNKRKELVAGLLKSLFEVKE
jgi:hypothetical protein